MAGSAAPEEAPAVASAGASSLPARTSSNHAAPCALLSPTQARYSVYSGFAGQVSAKSVHSVVPDHALSTGYSSFVCPWRRMRRFTAAPCRSFFAPVTLSARTLPAMRMSPITGFQSAQTHWLPVMRSARSPSAAPSATEA